jgi:hypothetical protein
MSKKIELGQFFTKRTVWLKPHIEQFILSIKFNKIVDPFAGRGHLLTPFEGKHITTGYDIDSQLNWPINDSLKSIPLHNDDLCITNPPYMAKTTTSRFNRTGPMEYFKLFPHLDDLYLIGLSQCFKSFPYGIAIIPETYLLSSKRSNRLISVTILEENPFDDTEFPVVVIIWGPDINEDFDIYKNDQFLGKHNTLIKKILSGKNLNRNRVLFNDPYGNLGIVCIDKPQKIGTIRFTSPDEIMGPIKGSSRTSTIVQVNTPVSINEIMQECNEILESYRKITSDIFMAPFKGNDAFGKRRRRLDFTMARRIIENAIVNLEQKHKGIDCPSTLFEFLE